MTWMGFIIIEYLCVYGYYFFRWSLIKYQNYKAKNRVTIDPYTRGISNRPLLFFMIVISCYWFTLDNSSFFIDYSLTDPWLHEFWIKDWDEAKEDDWFPATPMPFFGYYEIVDFYDYGQGDWGFPYGLKLHQFLIVLWWIWLVQYFVIELYWKYVDFRYLLYE